MKRFLYILILILALWMLVSPFLLGSSDWLRKGIDLALALVVVLLAYLGFRTPQSKYPARIILLIGLAMIIWGAIARPLTGEPGGASEIIVGMLWFFLSLLITQLFVFPKMSAYDKGGMELTAMSAIRYKKDNITIKAVLLGSMPSTIYIHPEEIWKVLALIDDSVIWHLPILLYRGWKRARLESSKADFKDNATVT